MFILERRINLIFHRLLGHFFICRFLGDVAFLFTLDYCRTDPVFSPALMKPLNPRWCLADMPSLG